MLENLLGRKPHLNHIRWHTADDAIPRNWLGHDRTRCDNRPSPDCDAGHNSSTVSDPYIILDDSRLSITAAGVPDGLSHKIDSMVVATDKRYIPADQDLTAERDVALDSATNTKLNIIAKEDSPVGRVEPHAHGTADEPPVFDKAITDIELDEAANPIGKLPKAQYDHGPPPG